MSVLITFAVSKFVMVQMFLKVPSIALVRLFLVCQPLRDSGFITSFNRIPNHHLTLRGYRCFFTTLTNLIFQQPSLRLGEVVGSLIV